ncbi:VCBS domain-containing protein [Halarcobacter sp.]|uniref:VCBS domain-containing protein n=1 Tax=Halarcobacter sp. TaxID=2321133 RepID=UPI003B000B3E
MYEGIRIQNGTQTVELNSLPKSENGELILIGIETLKVYLSNGASYLDANLEILENNDDVKIAFIDSNGDEVVIILRGLNVMLLTNSEEIPLLEVIDGNNSLISLRTIEDLDAAAAGATASSDVATADELEGDNLDLSTTFDGPSNPEGFGGLGEPIVVEPAAAETITFSGDISATITEDTGQSQDGVFSGTISNSAGLAFVPNTLTTSYGIFTINSTGNWTYDLDETLTNVQGLLDSESIIDNIVVSLIDGTTSFTIGVTIAGLNDKPEIENIFIGGYNDEINEGDLSFETSSKIDLEGVDDTSSEANNQYTGVINISDADISNTHNLSIISGSENIVDYNNSGVTLDDISISLVFNESTNEWEYNIEGNFSKLAVGESLTLSFDYQADDLRGFSGDPENDDTSNENSLSDIKTITLSVLGTNDKPVITDITTSSQLDETNTALTTNGLISVSDVDTTDEVTMHVDSVTISGTSNTKPTNAEALSMFSFSSNQILDNTQTSNSVNWEFNSGSENFDYLSEGETIVLEYVVSAVDNNVISSTNSINESSTSETKTVTVTITGTNDVVELASTVVAGDVVEDASDPVLSDSGDIAFTDVDLSDGHTVSVGNASVGALGVLTASITEGNDGDGAGVVSWEYTVSNAAVQYLSAGETKEESFDITIDDGEGSTDTKTVTVTITGTNDVVELASTVVAGDVVEDASDPVLSDSGDIAFTDVDLSDGHTVSVGNASVGALGVLTASITEGNDGDGAGVVSWEYTVSNAAVQYLSAGETKEESFDITIDDGEGSTDTKTVTVTITGTNDAPIITGGPDTADLIETDLGLTADGELTVSDVDILDLVSASVDSVSIGGTATSKPTNQDVIGMLSLSPLAILDNTETTDTLSWSFDSGNEAFDYLEEGETLILEYTVKAVDDHGAFDTETVTITITGTSDNEPPELQADTFDIVEDSAIGAYVGTVVATDVDGDSLTFTLLNNTDKFAIDNNGNITYIGNESNKLDYETTTEYNLNIQVSDGELTDVQSYTVDILNLNEEVSGGGTEILSGEGFTGTETNDNSNHIHTTSTEITGVVIENTESFDFTFGYTDNGGAVHTANVYDSSGTLVVSESFVAEKGEGSVTFSYTNNTGTDLTLTKLELVSTNSGFNFDSYSINYSLTSDQILTLAEVDTDGDHIDFVRLLEDSSNDLTSGIEPNSLDKVDMSSGDHILSNINVEDVLTITDTDNTLKIVGDSGDTLKLDASQWTDNGVNVDGETVYVGTSTTNETVTLLIEGVNIEEIS